MKLKDSLIIILAVVIAIGVGVFVGVELTEGNNDTANINTGTTNNNENNNSETNNDTNNNNNNTVSVKYTYDDIQGIYTYDDEEDEHFGCIFNIYDNGTFDYMCGGGGSMGNYIIKDNYVVLNYLFSTGSDVNIYGKTGSDTITISDKNTLVFTNPTNWVGTKSAITLKRDRSSEASQYLQNSKKFFSDCLIKECILNNLFTE